MLRCVNGVDEDTCSGGCCLSWLEEVWLSEGSLGDTLAGEAWLGETWLLVGMWLGSESRVFSERIAAVVLRVRGGREKSCGDGNEKLLW
ncbi:hypothetical protein F2Q69_00005533 [Brassica cretica]|uniref:Uncharacterized protein n=1 Tax=Brassica cretica TaxID=69181 RepID=A0A8S9P459_BRACR|nr:hypothetical protein F2Q69_00005533 [Brassica cretica]